MSYFFIVIFISIISESLFVMIVSIKWHTKPCTLNSSKNSGTNFSKNLTNTFEFEACYVTYRDILYSNLSPGGYISGIRVALDSFLRIQVQLVACFRTLGKYSFNVTIKISVYQKYLRVLYFFSVRQSYYDWMLISSVIITVCKNNFLSNLLRRLTSLRPETSHTC